MPSPAELIGSPYDTEARYSTKRGMEWVGYNVHLTETCDEGTPHLIVNVETTPATTPDDNMIEVVHKSEQGRDLLPGEHLVDKGYTDAHVLVESQREYGVTIIGPVAEDPSWQARAGEGFDVCSGRDAPRRRRSRGSSACRHASITRRCRRPGSGRRPRSSASSTRCVPGSKERMNKRFDAVD